MRPAEDAPTLEAFPLDPRAWRFEFEPELSGLQFDRRPPREVGYEDSGSVADVAGVDVFIGVGAARDGRRVQSRLVGEGFHHRCSVDLVRGQTFAKGGTRLAQLTVTSAGIDAITGAVTSFTVIDCAELL